MKEVATAIDAGVGGQTVTGEIIIVDPAAVQKASLQ